jgi:hypothetical protein
MVCSQQDPLRGQASIPGGLAYGFSKLTGRLAAVPAKLIHLTGGGLNVQQGIIVHGLANG